MPSPNTPNSTNRRVTLRMIADELGITKTTVSLALRGKTCISEKTRAMVLKKAKELDYRPDPTISAIASQRWKTGISDRHEVIAFLCNRLPERQDIQMNYLKEAKVRCEEYGYRPEFFYVDDYPTAKSISRVLFTRGIRGILIPPISNPESKRAMQLDWDKFTAVCCGVGRVRPRLHTANTDYFEMTQNVWMIVKDAGYKRIGAAICGHTPAAQDDWHRFGASYASIHLFGLEESAKIPFHTYHVLEEAPLLEWYERYRPEVIIGFNSYTGEILERHGVRIPEDVEFVSLTTDPGTKWSGVVIPYSVISSHAVDMLVNELRDNRGGIPSHPNHFLITPEWNKGTTFTHCPEDKSIFTPCKQEVSSI